MIEFALGIEKVYFYYNKSSETYIEGLFEFNI